MIEGLEDILMISFKGDRQGNHGGSLVLSYP